MLRTAARYADAWVTEGAYPELRGRKAGIADVVRCTRKRLELLDDEAAAVGREPRSIARVFLAGFTAGFVPHAVVHYRFRNDLRSAARQAYDYSRSIAKLYTTYRHHGMKRRSLVLSREAGRLARRPPARLVSGFRTSGPMGVAGATYAGRAGDREPSALRVTR
jgi:hypothetical protein